MIARAHIQGISAHRVADPNQPSVPEVDLDGLGLTIGKSSQSCKDQIDSSSIVVPADFTPELDISA